ncbi:MAG: hypothetical protein HOO95_00880, partial [Gallionella sp.]|nr:hypothetical protein [Gallionella sp.]
MSAAVARIQALQNLTKHSADAAQHVKAYFSEENKKEAKHRAAFNAHGFTPARSFGRQIAEWQGGYKARRVNIIPDSWAADDLAEWERIEAAVSQRLANQWLDKQNSPLFEAHGLLVCTEDDLQSIAGCMARRCERSLLAIGDCVSS